MENNMNNGYVKFWGVRGSNPTPDKDKMYYGGDTSCICLLYTSPSPRDRQKSRMPSSA